MDVHLLKIIILGCGSSAGVPLITGNWGDCDPQDIRNRRTRASLAVRTDSHTWLIDTSPDLRAQCLRENITQIHGVLYTHAHFDHTAGINELRPFSFAQKMLIPIWADSLTRDQLFHSYRYAFSDDMASAEAKEVYMPFVKGHIIDLDLLEPIDLKGMSVVPFVQDHRYSHTLGFRFGNWAYSTDIWEMDDKAFSALAGIQLWIVDCLSYFPSATHSHLERTLSWIARLRPKQAILTHMGIHLDYQKLSAQLPSHVLPAYDGMCIDMPFE